MSATTDFRVLIIGGGPAGLLTAQSLRKRGIQSTVFEQDVAIDSRSRDWNFGIYWAQVPLSDCLPDEWQRLLVEDCQVDNRLPSADQVLPAYNSHTGELLKKIPAPYNIRLHRRNLIRLLRTNIDVRYGKRLQRVESNGQTATAHFEDGTSESGNLLIGAEGAHSRVREFLVGEEEAKLVTSPIVASSTMARLPKETAILFQQKHPRSLLAFNPDGEFMWMGVHDAWAGTEPGDWNFFILQTWVPEHEHDPSSLQGSDILPDLKSRSKKFAEPFRSFVETIPDGTKCWHNQLSYWLPRPWDNRNGTVSLVGDAAHPMTFHRGQGLNNAIHDAASLARHLSELGTSSSPSGESAVATYEREMIERGRSAVEMSNENSLSIHNWRDLMNSPLFTIGLQKPQAKQQAMPQGTDIRVES